MAFKPRKALEDVNQVTRWSKWSWRYEDKLMGCLNWSAQQMRQRISAKSVVQFWHSSGHRWFTTSKLGYIFSIITWKRLLMSLILKFWYNFWTVLRSDEDLLATATLESRTSSDSLWFSQGCVQVQTNIGSEEWCVILFQNCLRMGKVFILNLEFCFISELEHKYCRQT